MSESQPTIADWLEQQGYTPDEVAKILARLAEYDQNTVSDAVFDSIGLGTMNLDVIIRQALEGK
jgi:hypothetical protein